jgi:hypothetical protein
MRHSRAPLVALAALLSGCLGYDRIERREIWYRQPTVARAQSTTGRTAAPRESWPAPPRVDDQLLGRTAPTNVGLLTKEGALQTIREAPDPESAISALEARRFAFKLDEPTLAWFAENGVQPEVFDYLAKRSKVDWENLHDSSDADRASEYAQSTIQPPENVIVQTWDAPPPPPPLGTTVVEVWPGRYYWGDNRWDRWDDPVWRTRWRRSNTYSPPVSGVYVGGYVGTPNYRGVVPPSSVRVVAPATPPAGLYAPPPPPPAPRPILRGTVTGRRHR